MGVESNPLSQEAIAAVFAQVERINATALSSSPRLQSFLRYIVERSLAGQADCLKEYSIGLEVYQKRPDYDPKTDATVRGEASRLRSRLARHYETNGRDDPVFITVPKGAYVPAFEIRYAPKGESSESAPDPTPYRPHGRRIRPALAWAAVVAIACVALIVARSDSFQAGEGISSMAVLPFQSLVPEPTEADEALGIGIAEGVIARLSSSPDLTVRPASEVVDARKKEGDAIAAGRKLRVSGVLDGSFHRAGDRIHLTARLVRTTDGKQLWSAQFDAAADDIPALEEQVADHVARALTLQLASPGRRRAPRPEAFEACKRGRYHMFRYTADDAIKSLKQYALAAEKDPDYAPAHAGLAWAYIQHVEFGLLPNSVGWMKAQEAAERAVQVDDSSFEAHVALADVQFGYAWDWAGAERSFRRALALNPRDIESLGAWRNFLIATGRLEEGLVVSRQMRDLDPLSPRLNLNIANALLTLRRYDEALQAARAALELAPEFAGTHELLAEVYYRKGMYDEWFDATTRARELSQEPPRIRAALIGAYRTGGVRGYWQKNLELLEDSSRNSRVSSIALARVCAELGLKNRALQYLEQSYAERDPSLVHLKTSWTFDPLRSDPRFEALLERMKLH